MPYYGAGDYYQGDNYAAGGFLGSIGKFVGGVARRVIGATPVGMALSLVPNISNRQPGVLPMIPNPGALPKPGLRGKIERFLPGGATGYYQRRRMNVTNVKALRRAGRRVKGFLKIASRLGALPVNRGKGKRLFKRKSR